MVIQSATLDPNAQAYTDDQIVGKINTAAIAISRTDAIDPAALGDVDSDDITEGAANKYDTGVPPTDLDGLPDGTTRKAMSDTEKTKLGGVEEGAEVNIGEEFTMGEQTKLTGIEADAKGDQTGAEVRDLILALADTDRGLVVTDPTTGEFKVISIERKADGKFNLKYDDVAEP